MYEPGISEGFTQEVRERIENNGYTREELFNLKDRDCLIYRAKKKVRLLMKHIVRYLLTLRLRLVKERERDDFLYR